MHCNDPHTFMDSINTSICQQKELESDLACRFSWCRENLWQEYNRGMDDFRVEDHIKWEAVHQKKNNVMDNPFLTQSLILKSIIYIYTHTCSIIIMQPNFSFPLTFFTTHNIYRAPTLIPLACFLCFIFLSCQLFGSSYHLLG